MKTKFIASIALLLTLVAIAEDTNELFVTERDMSRPDPNHPPGIPAIVWMTYSREQLLVWAMTNRECLPAKDFREGNWGEPGSGFQLSLRFERTTYTNGEPIRALILVRNTSDGNIIPDNYNASHRYENGGAGSLYEGGPVGIVLITPSGKPFNPRKLADSIAIASSGFPVVISPKSQFRYCERLDQMYDLTNGTYSAHAVIDAGQHWTNQVTSAEVPITIVGSPPSSK